MSLIVDKLHVPVDPDDDENDPFYYGWRYEEDADGNQTARQIPLAYADLLSPEVGDFIAESTIHHQVITRIEAILRHRYADEPAVAVWSDLKISFVVPGLTTGPGPDVFVVEGVEDRDRDRRSFRYGKEPGKIVLTVEVASHKSEDKDYRDILEIYSRLGVGEYLAVRPIGQYSEGPFELDGWRRNPADGRLEPIRPDPFGRLHLRAVGLLAGTGDDGWGLKLWDADSGEQLRTPEEAEAERADEAEERAAQAEKRAEQEAAARRAAEQEAEQARAARRAAEEEIEKLRADARKR